MNGTSLGRRSAGAVCILLLMAFAAQGIVLADEGWVPPEEPDTKSMGFPRHWRPSVGAMLDWERRGPGSELGGEIHGAIYKDLINPATNVAGITGEGYATWVDDDTDGGLRLFLSSPAAMFHLGLDYSFGNDQVDFVFSLTPAFRRGGLFGLGDHLRIDWYPERDHSFMFGFGIPLEKNMGKTRPKAKKVTLPKKSGSPSDEIELAADVQNALENLDHAARWVQVYTAPFLDLEMGTDEKRLAAIQERIDAAKAHYHQQGDLYPAGHTAAAERAVYHQELERAFALAGAGDAAAHVAAEARAILLDQVFVPYNRLLGQRKERDSLLGYAADAERDFAAWLETTPEIAANKRPALAQVFHQVVRILDDCRELTHKRWEDSRLVWMSLDLVLQPEDHDSQGELDALLAKVVDEPFSDANDILYLKNELFQIELAKGVLAARDYHVLWIHDYRGLNAIKEPDRVAFLQTVQVYLRALTERVREFDQTKQLASYFIFLDQMYYEANQGQLWLALLADPLHHEVDLPEGYEDWEAEIESAQESLRAAVDSSAALSAGRELYGDDWLRNRVSVHVNITNPADVSFRSDDLAKYINFAPDLVMRDHRKIAFYDISELDPGRGAAIFTGEGVGEHYAGPTWDDRAMLVRGPAILGLKEAARDLLRSQGFKAEEIPAPFRAQALPDDYDLKLVALREKGWRATALQVHNVTGFGPKAATVAKAAQYNLMPAGSFLMIPDSLWNSTLWGSMLCGAALRGCQVAVVCPSLTNAPSDGLPQMSRTTELYTRFLLINREFGDELRAAGGSLHTGIYDHDVASGDHARSMRMLSENLARNAFLRQAFPFDDEVIAGLAAMADTLDAMGYSERHLAEDVLERKPKLHLKVQFMATREVIPNLAPRPEWLDFLREYTMVHVQQVEERGMPVDARGIREAIREPATALIENWWQGLTNEEREHAALYMTIGSHNQNYRSVIMDGEVLVAVSGYRALWAYVDFVRTFGLSTWVTDQDQLEQLLPKPTGIGRWMRNAI